MQSFDKNQLFAHEIAIRLETNSAVDVGRFFRLVECLGDQGSADGPLPPYRLNIVEFSKGSIFGRFKIDWGNGIDDERLRRMQAVLDTLESQQGGDTKRAADAAERQADAAEAQTAIQRKGLFWTRFGAAIGAATLVCTVGSLIKSEDPNLCATAVADLMELDGVSRVQIWSRDCTVDVRKQDVPEVQRRELGIRAATGTAHATSSSNFESADVPFPQASFGPSSADVPPDLLDQRYGQPPSRLEDHLDFPAGWTPGAGEIYRGTGVFEMEGDLMFFLPDEPRRGGVGEKTRALFIPPDQFMLGEQQRYRVEGRYFSVPRGLDVVAGKSATLL